MSEPVAHMYPSDLKRFEASETFAEAYSVAVGNPSEESVPLYTTPQPVEVFDPVVKVEAGSGRPDCFEFAMDFLGEPEESRIRAYVERLEAMLTGQEKQQ